MASQYQTQASDNKAGYWVAQMDKHYRDPLVATKYPHHASLKSF